LGLAISRFIPRQVTADKNAKQDRSGYCS
jgi:hypothetical protein